MRQLLILGITLLIGCGGQAPSTPDDTTPAPPTEPPGSGTTTLQASPDSLAFPGTSEASFTVQADGPWEITSDQSWLNIEPASGTGNATVTVMVNRSGLTPEHYAGTLLLKGDEARETVSIYMRFPTLTGNLFSATNQLEPASLGTQNFDEETVVPGEVLVKLEPAMVALRQGLSIQGSRLPELSLQALQTDIAELADDYGLEVLEVLSPALPVFKLNTKGQNLETVLKTLRKDGRVAYAEPNRKITSFATPNDPRYTDQWHYDNIGLPSAWDLTEGSEEVVVAVLDSGVDAAHPDLAGQLVPGYDFVRNTTQMTDLDGHGTHVTGTIVAASNNSVGVAGVAWRSKVMPVRVLSSVEASSDEFNLYRGVLFATGLCVSNSNDERVCPEQQAQVINMSLGLSDASNPCSILEMSYFDHEALAIAAGAGTTLIASSGNSSCGAAYYPAADPSVLAVSATGPGNDIAPYSNTGLEIWVAAPGGDGKNFGQAGQVLSTLPDGKYGYDQGTSMASPHVAGVVALMLAANPDLTPTDVRLILQLSSTDLGDEGWDPIYGYGLVDAEGAVGLARSLLTARNSAFIVRLREGPRTVAEGQVDAGGNFKLENLSAGDYTLEAGNDLNGNGILGDPGEFYGRTEVSVDYDGNTASGNLKVEPR